MEITQNFKLALTHKYGVPLYLDGSDTSVTIEVDKDFVTFTDEKTQKVTVAPLDRQANSFTVKLSENEICNVNYVSPGSRSVRVYLDVPSTITVVRGDAKNG